MTSEAIRDWEEIVGVVYKWDFFKVGCSGRGLCFVCLLLHSAWRRWIVGGMEDAKGV